MPTLTTQSIGVVTAQVTGAQASLQNARAAEVSQTAGVQLNLNRQHAQNSSAQAREDRDRTIQREARAEGSFASQDEEHEEKADKAAHHRGSGSRLNTVA